MAHKTVDFPPNPALSLLRHLSAVRKQDKLRAAEAKLARALGEHEQLHALVHSGNTISSVYLDQLIKAAGAVGYYREIVGQLRKHT